MTHRQRKLKRRRRHTGRSSVLLGLGVLATVSIIAAAVGRRLRARDRRDRSRPLRAEACRQGPALRGLRRRRLAPRLHPVGRAAPRRALARHPGEPAPRHGRHRGRALLQARRRGPQRDRARRHQEPRVRQDRAGRLDHHAAARARALHQGSEARLRPQDPRGQAGLRARGRALEDLDPPQLPELGPVRHGRRADRDRRRGRRGHVLRQAREESRPRRVGDDRRPAAGAVAVQPLPQRAGGDPAPQRGHQADGLEPLHHAGGGGRGDTAAGEAEARHALRDPPRAVHVRLRAGAADRALRLRSGPPRRPADPHHDQPQGAGRRAAGDRGTALRPETTPRPRS